MTSATGNIMTRRKGRVTVTGNTEVGTNLGVNCVIHAAPTKSSLLYTQKTGRSTRLDTGKVDCVNHRRR